MDAFGSRNRPNGFNAFEGNQNFAELKRKLLDCKVDGLFNHLMIYCSQIH